ncbi:peptidase M3, partial [Bacillus wiedmannii]
SLLMSSVAGDVFQHWLYSNPNHTSEERDKKYAELCKRYQYSSVNIAGLEDEIGASWLESFHYVQFPFYKIEYAIAQIGAMQLFQIYREDPKKAIAFFKEGASADWNLPIQEIYEKTGVTFDFSEESTASVIFDLINELK